MPLIKKYHSGKIPKNSDFLDNVYVLWENPPFVYNLNIEPRLFIHHNNDNSVTITKQHSSPKILNSNSPYSQWFETRSFIHIPEDFSAFKNFFFGSLKKPPFKIQLGNFAFQPEASFDTNLNYNLHLAKTNLKIMNSNNSYRPKFRPLKNSSALRLNNSSISKFHVVSNQNHFHFLTQLNLSNNNISAISNSLFRLTMLERLDLENNFITSSPKSLKPKLFNKLKRLNHLNLSNNLLTSIPSDFGLLPNLNLLNISYNKVYFIPVEILALETLIFTNCPLISHPHNENTSSSFLKYLKKSPLFDEYSYSATTMAHSEIESKLSFNNPEFINYSSKSFNNKLRSNLSTLNLIKLINFNTPNLKAYKINELFIDRRFANQSTDDELLFFSSLERDFKPPEMFTNPKKYPVLVHRTQSVPRLADLAASVVIRSILFSKINKLGICPCNGNFSICECISSKQPSPDEMLQSLLGLSHNSNSNDIFPITVKKSVLNKISMKRSKSLPNLKIAPVDLYSDDEAKNGFDVDDINKIEMKDIFPNFPEISNKASIHMGTVWNHILENYISNNSAESSSRLLPSTTYETQSTPHPIKPSSFLFNVIEPPRIESPCSNLPDHQLLSQPAATKWPLWLIDLAKLNLDTFFCFVCGSVCPLFNMDFFVSFNSGPFFHFAFCSNMCKHQALVKIFR
ncbi:Glucose-repressible alcohol dehydrogenase transcriptional effector [Smittium culicis]|uniref:Glucose-repressible alcohol dehydrogenase transcriptional effector n=1 Tax=Smittium culicis TaxID=133412 RepID=A0A1R1YES4_9FUNG|nr:Glucose-repressible alcohol dehydrogenase transcriptional effector [Smittium culicis]